MASITCKRGNGRIWYAVWKMNGKNKIKSTDIPVAGDATMTRAQAEKTARLKANMMEDVAKGRTTVSRASDAFRSVAVASGIGAEMPSVHDYLRAYQGEAGAKTESNRKRAFNVFLDYLGERAEMRLDMLTKNDVLAFLRHALTEVSVGTVGLYRTYLSAAFNKALDEELLMRSPMPRLNLVKLGKEVNPELKRDKMKRLPFTPDELRLMVSKFPAPWCDMSLVAAMTGGQRIGDICCLRWDSIDFSDASLCFSTGKTDKEMDIPLHPLLRQRLLDIRKEQGGREEYVFPNMARRYMRGDSSVSTEFTSLLKVWGIVKPSADSKSLKGRRRNVSQKSFHSFRHTVVSALRTDASISEDLAMAIVGHDDPEVERAYYTASRNDKMRGLNVIAKAISLPVVDELPAYSA